VNPGSIIAANVVVKEGVTIPAGSMCSIYDAGPKEDGDEGGDQELETNKEFFE